MSISTSGDRSTMPVFGMKRRIGVSSGSVVSNRKRADRALVRRVDPAEQNARDNDEPQHGDEELDEDDDELGQRAPSIGLVRRSGRSPKRTRPSRTTVAPSSTAISKSSLMPIDRPGPMRASFELQLRAQFAQRAERGTRQFRVSEPGGRLSSAREPRDGPAMQLSGEAAPKRHRARNPAFAGSRIDVHLQEDRIRRRRASAERRSRRSRERHGVDRVDHFEQLDGP